jgi:hypothetical protein
MTVAALSVVVPNLSANATTYYKYWSYWHKPPGSTTWHYSQVGASGYYLQKGTQVEGWRFAVGTASSHDPQPRPTTATYDGYCHDANADKAYRVLLVVDYGTDSNAPAGPVYSCYGYDSSVSGFTVLTQQHSERDSNGLICAVDQYPRSGCGDTVSSPAPRASQSPVQRVSPRPTTHASVRSSQPSAAAGGATSAPAKAASKSTSPGAATTTTVGASPGDSGPTAASAPSARPFTGPPAGAHSAGFPIGIVIGLVVAAGLGAAAWLRLRRG